jgi:hypothetical protein
MTPNSSMPIGSFRRPELRAAAEIKAQVTKIPRKYSMQIAGSDNVEKYMSLQLASVESPGTSVAQVKDMLKRHPFMFDFRDLTVKDKSHIYRVSKNFNSVDIHKFFRVSKYSLMAGIWSLNRLIDAKESTKRVLADLETEVQEILNAREKFASDITKRYEIAGLELEQIYYVFGPTNRFELAEFFFASPSSFGGWSHCSKCEREITNWISVMTGEGPICGEHGYEIANIGKSLHEVTEQVIDLVERKFTIQADSPMSPNSALVNFRKSRLDYFGGPNTASGDLYLDQTPFWRNSILRDIQLGDQPSDYWKEYIFNRVLLEYQPRQKAEDFDDED